MRPDIETKVDPRPRPDADGDPRSARSGHPQTGARPGPSGRRRRVTVAAFQAVVEERLRNLEEELADVKGRVNGLIFLIAGTVVAQVLLRLFA